jgi:hypothetical protein
MKKERFIKLFEGLLYFIEQEEPEEEETSIEGEEDKETEVETETGKDEVEPPKEEAQEEDVDSTEDKLSNVDKVYRLKIIYSKLIAISRVLDYYSDKKFDELRDDILEAIDLFHIVVSNFDDFKDKIDDIINSYYKLLNKSMEVLDSLSNKQE